MTQATDTEVPWLTNGESEDWMALMDLLLTLPAALDAQLKRDAGMNTFEYHVLVALDATPGGVQPMTDLAELTRVSPSRLSHAVTRLERAGWVERRECREAGRRTAAVLTEAGREKLRDTAPGHVREARRLVVDALAPEQLAALGTSARTIVAQAAPEVARALPDC